MKVIIRTEGGVIQWVGSNLPIEVHIVDLEDIKADQEVGIRKAKTPYEQDEMFRDMDFDAVLDSVIQGCISE